jgi:hypothetical protein
MSGCSREARRCVACAEAPVQLRPAAPRCKWFERDDAIAGVAERAMHLARNEDNAGSIPVASSRIEERLYDECNDDAGISAQREL